MMCLTFGLFTQVSETGPLVFFFLLLLLLFFLQLPSCDIVVKLLKSMNILAL